MFMEESFISHKARLSLDDYTWAYDIEKFLNGVLDKPKRIITTMLKAIVKGDTFIILTEKLIIVTSFKRVVLLSDFNDLEHQRINCDLEDEECCRSIIEWKSSSQGT